MRVALQSEIGLPFPPWISSRLRQYIIAMKATKRLMPYRRLRVIAVVSLSILVVTLSASFLLCYRSQNLKSSMPGVKVYGFYEFCEALAPRSGVVEISVTRDPLAASVTTGSETEFERLKALVKSSMLTTAAF
jgi:hypothetical protein